ncbi:relaxase [Ornithobacterium rhinotracheale]|uniref:conjugal transfer protein MobB n=1 Tax=Ornithobacterium rhinotracheale TaxID=28251 RepID=UPI00129D1500|nr:conjugal transfer protein MobB [Ornithobacterium rhinotracheale]MRJ11270.1 relaxase [Ornithobacterium rhinotracheale]
MVAKIGRGSNLLGVLLYNYEKVEDDHGNILHTHRMIHPLDGQWDTSVLARSFEPYLIANQKTEKPILHISINPDPKDEVSDQDFKEIATEYMQEMGYGNQPFVVFKHTDIERMHIHIVSVCVDEQGKKINDAFEKRKSMRVCRALEEKFGLQSALDKKEGKDKALFQPVDYRKADIKSQLASIVRYIHKYYQFQSLGEYTALLKLLNIGTEKVEGELHGEHRQGLVYFALDENGEKVSNPFKSSLFGKKAGLPSLEKQMEKHKPHLKKQDKSTLKQHIKNALKSTQSKAEFMKALVPHKISVVFRENDQGRLYGVTFIDHNSRCVWNGSRLGKDFSANFFHQYFAGQNDQQITEQTTEQSQFSYPEELKNSNDNNFQEITYYEYEYDYPTIKALFSLLPEDQGVDYEEEAFIHRMRRKKKKIKKRKK